jgi:hypothetical protein
MKLEPQAEACLKKIREEVYSNTSVDHEDNLEALEYIQGEISIMMEGLQEDIDARNGE